MYIYHRTLFRHRNQSIVMRFYFLILKKTFFFSIAHTKVKLFFLILLFLGRSKGSGKNKEIDPKEKKQELEKRLQDCSGQLQSNNKKNCRKGILFFYIGYAL